VIDKNTAFINGLVGSEIYAMKHGRHLYHLARNTFHPQPYGIACPPGAPYTPVLNLMLGRMVQAGLVDKWHRDEVTNFMMKQSSEQIKQKDQTQETEVGQGRVAVRSLALDHLQTSQHSDVVIVHDYTNSGVKELVKSFSERWAATTILTATPAPDLSQLLVALSTFHTNDLRYMVLLCSANTTRTVFDMVRDQNLESRRVRWLVVEEEPDLADPLLYTLREGSLTATSGIFKAIHDSLDPSRSFATYGTIAVGEVVEKNTAYMSGRVGSEIYAIQNGRQRYHLARDTFMPQPYGIVCPSGAPFTPTFSLMLGRMVESGLVDKWHRDEVTNFIIQQTASQGKGEDQGAGTNMGQVRVAIKPLSLDHLQGGFYILGLGSLVAGSVLITETLAYPLI
ncbi:hypothetical protein Pcinc_030055, partial [Petrolisthes cinctipes]